MKSGERASLTTTTGANGHYEFTVAAGCGLVHEVNFRFDGGEHHFNLQTGGFATGTYLLSFKAGGSPATYTVEFKVR